MSLTSREESPSFLGRAWATLLGGAASAVTYAGWLLFWPSRATSTGAWSLSGPVKWFVIVGALLGAIGGLRFAEWLWASAVDDLRSDAVFNGWVALVVLGIIVIVAVALKLWPA